MAEEMVLIPRVRYDKLLASSSESVRDNDNDNAAAAAAPAAPDAAANETPAVGKGFEESRKKNKQTLEGKKGQDNHNVSKEKNSTNKEEKMPIDIILNEVSSEYRDTAERTLKQIIEKGDIEFNWNDRGRLISKGSVVNGSNMSELLQHFFSKRKGKAPAGFKLFVKGVEKINGSSVRAESGGKKKGQNEKEMVASLQKSWISY